MPQCSSTRPTALWVNVGRPHSANPGQIAAALLRVGDLSSKWIAVAVFGDVAQVNGDGVQTCRTLVDRGCSALCIIRSSLHAATNCGEGRHDKQVVVAHGYQRSEEHTSELQSPC